MNTQLVKFKKTKNLFCGSIEIEVNSTQDMVFPFQQLQFLIRVKIQMHMCIRVVEFLTI